MKSFTRYSILLTSASLLFGSAMFAQSSARPAAAPKANNTAPATDASATAPAPGMVLPTPAKDNPAASSITGALDVAAAMDAIQMQPFDAHQKVAAEIEQRVTSSASRLDGLKSSLSGLTEEGKAQFTKAVKDAEARRADLLNSVNVARNATEASWEGARATLAASYATYAETIARAELGLSKTVVPPANATK